jgi:hypothetical protein
MFELPSKVVTYMFHSNDRARRRWRFKNTVMAFDSDLFPVWSEKKSEYAASKGVKITY